MKAITALILVLAVSSSIVAETTAAATGNGGTVRKDTLLNIIRIRNAKDNLYMTMEIEGPYAGVPVLSQKWQNLKTQAFEHILETCAIICAKTFVFRPLSAPENSLLSSNSVALHNQTITQFSDSRRYNNQRFTPTYITEENVELKQNYDCGITCDHACVASYGEGQRVLGPACDKSQTDLSQQWILEPLDESEVANLQ